MHLCGTQRRLLVMCQKCTSLGWDVCGRPWHLCLQRWYDLEAHFFIAFLWQALSKAILGCGLVVSGSLKNKYCTSKQGQRQEGIRTSAELPTLFFQEATAHIYTSHYHHPQANQTHTKPLWCKTSHIVNYTSETNLYNRTKQSSRQCTLYVWAALEQRSSPWHQCTYRSLVVGLHQPKS